MQITTQPSDATGGAVDPNGFGYGDYDGLTRQRRHVLPLLDRLPQRHVEEIWSARLSLVPKQAYFVLDRSSLGQDEVNAMLVQASPFDDLARVLRRRRRLHRPRSWASPPPT